MVRDRANWRKKMRCAVVALTTAAVSFVCLGGRMVHAQSIMRSPNLNIGPRVPSIHPNLGPRIAPNVAGRGDFSGRGDRTTPRLVGRNSASADRRPAPAVVIRSTLPYLRL